MERSRFKRVVAAVIITVMGAAVFVFAPAQARAEQKINAAVVAGFIQTFQELASAFEAKTGIKIDVSFSSAGRLYSQITNGAPYDIFLSADTERPDLLFQKGISEKPFIYAVGGVVLWSANKSFCSSDRWQTALRQGGVKRIAIVTPETGVHGEKARKALQDAGLWNLLASRMVYGPDMAQVFQYASEGSVDAAFCAHSLTYTERGKKGCYYRMKEAPDVVYSACVLKNAKNRELAERLAAFIVSPEAEKIMKKYGYKPIRDKH